MSQHVQSEGDLALIRKWGNKIKGLNLDEPNDVEILNTPTYRDEFPNMELEDILYSQHLIILNLKKENAELRRDLTGHNTSLNQNY